MQSAVANLLAQIRAEYEAAQRGLYAPSLGTSQHAFIPQKMERMGAMHSALCGLVGEQQAIALIAAEREECSDEMMRPSHDHRFSCIVAASVCQSCRG